MGNQEQTTNQNTEVSTQSNQTPTNLSHVDIGLLEKMEKRLEGWKRYLAYAYIVICLVDFALMPIIFELHRPQFTELAKVIGALAPEAQLMALNKTSWQPITLSYSGMFHLVIGAILTGVAVFNNKFSNNTSLPR